MDKRVYLKVKIKSLASEAKIIRKEERKNRRFKRGLQDHRKGIVRWEARHTLLAYGFLRGKKYSELEHKPHEKPDFARVATMVTKYGVFWDHDTQSSEEWIKMRDEQQYRLKDWIATAK